MRIWLPGVRGRALGRRLRRTWRLSPPTILAGSFLVLIVVGALVLWLPWSSPARYPLNFWQALFTATSAVTVTGLTLIDVGHLTLFGQIVMVLLFHLGGLGLMTFAALTVIALGGRLGLRGQRLVREAMDQTSPGDVLVLVRYVVILALSVEAVGTILLASVWVPEMGFWHGLWFSVFHAVSAFNNAGFGLRADNLAPWVGQPVIIIVIGVLVITGGLGFTVLIDLFRKRRFSRLSLHSKLTLAGTAALILGGWGLVMLFEWGNAATLGALNDPARVLAGWFMAVTPRTAGFSSINVGALTTPAELVVMTLMFIGGGSSSTASGIKVSTFMVIILATRAFLKGETHPHAFGRTVSMAVVFRAYAVVVLSVMLIVVAGFLLVILQPGMKPLDLFFEAFSAFGTAGLTRGITTDLSQGSQAILMVLMFAGRVGPLALAFSMARPRQSRLRYTEDRVQVG
jgi:trk system potassium uptake protein TrkH